MGALGSMFGDAAFQREISHRGLAETANNYMRSQESKQDRHNVEAEVAHGHWLKSGDKSTTAAGSSMMARNDRPVGENDQKATAVGRSRVSLDDPYSSATRLGAPEVMSPYTYSTRAAEQRRAAEASAQDTRPSLDFTKPQRVLPQRVATPLPEAGEKLKSDVSEAKQVAEKTHTALAGAKNAPTPELGAAYTEHMTAMRVLCSKSLEMENHSRLVAHGRMLNAAPEAKPKAESELATRQSIYTSEATAAISAFQRMTANFDSKAASSQTTDDTKMFRDLGETAGKHAAGLKTEAAAHDVSFGEQSAQARSMAASMKSSKQSQSTSSSQVQG